MNRYESSLVAKLIDLYKAYTLINNVGNIDLRIALMIKTEISDTISLLEKRGLHYNY